MYLSNRINVLFLLNPLSFINTLFFFCILGYTQFC